MAIFETFVKWAKNTPYRFANAHINGLAHNAGSGIDHTRHRPRYNRAVKEQLDLVIEHVKNNEALPNYIGTITLNPRSNAEFDKHSRDIQPVMPLFEHDYETTAYIGNIHPAGELTDEMLLKKWNIGFSFIAYSETDKLEELIDLDLNVNLRATIRDYSLLEYAILTEREDIALMLVNKDADFFSLSKKHPGRGNAWDMAQERPTLMEKVIAAMASKSAPRPPSIPAPALIG